MNTPYELIGRYLAGECNDNEREQIQQWARQHPDLMDEYVRLWQQASGKEFHPDVEQALRKVNQRIDKKEKKTPKRLYLAISSVAAAVILLLISVTGIRYWDAANDVRTSVNLLALETGIRETIEYELPDGSKVWLNQASVVRYPETFTGNTREIYLEGEAFFDIAPDAGKPFIIHANGTQTRVVGTSFGIRAVKEEDEVVVTVSTGIINLSAEGKSGYVELRKGEQGTCLPKKQLLEKNETPDPNLLAWKTKILTFKQTPLAEVAKVIGNTYHIPVTVDPSISRLQLTSTFEQRSIDEIMEIIELSLQVTAETTDGGILLKEK
ncbi:FecR family protein [Bacteroides sp. UBA939]|uniref:FecR family protein n=1 Tax=Bacteroides sp. UBA939 TaxID=1946092 RepID=UPI0025B8DEAD|nr:FecR domain-containing protein [Bacteroides sp. UBA939]